MYKRSHSQSEASRAAFSTDCGPPRPERIAAIATDQMNRVTMLLHEDDISSQDVGRHCAEVVLALYQLAEMYGFNLLRQVDMAIERKANGREPRRAVGDTPYEQGHPPGCSPGVLPRLILRHMACSVGPTPY